MPIAVNRMAAGDIDGDGLNDLVVLGVENQCLVLIQSNPIRRPAPLTYLVQSASDHKPKIINHGIN